jgi:transcriptional regulator with XRE-family HTH domain
MRTARDARIAHGLSQGTVATSLGISRSQYSRIERGLAPNISVVMASRMLSVLGLELSARAYPVGEPLRDAAHAATLERLRRGLAANLRWRTEVVFPQPGDRRAWDATISGADDVGLWVIGVEAEMRPRDIQALERRLAVKERDGGVDGLILLLADTRHNRALPRSHPGLLERFPVPGRQALATLAAGRRLSGNAMILI